MSRDQSHAYWGRPRGYYGCCVTHEPSVVALIKIIQTHTCTPFNIVLISVYQGMSAVWCL